MMKKKVGGIDKIIKKSFVIKLILILLLTSKNAFGTLVIDYEIEKFLKNIVKPIILVSKVNFEDSNIVIILDNNPNAVTDQLNRIIITTGLIAFADRPEEILGVLAHEIGHIQANHIDKRISIIEKNKSISNLATLLSLSASIITDNPDYVLSSSIAYGEIFKNRFSNYSKDQEREADILALEYLEKNQITSMGLINLLKRLILSFENVGINEDKINVYTHPYKKERIDTILDFQKKSKFNNFYFSNSINLKFKFVKAKINGHTLSLEKNKMLYKRFDTDDKKYALSISYAREGYMEESLKLINHLIINYKDNPFFYEAKGEILLNFGYSDESIKFFKKSLSLDNSNDYLRIKLISLLFNELKNHNNVNRIIEEYSLLKINKNNNKILNILSKTYEYLNNISYQYYYKSMIEKNNGNNKLAIDYLNYAKLNTNDPKIINKIDILENKLKNEK